VIIDYKAMNEICMWCAVLEANPLKILKLKSHCTMLEQLTILKDLTVIRFQAMF